MARKIKVSVTEAKFNYNQEAAALARHANAIVSNFKTPLKASFNTDFQKDKDGEIVVQCHVRSKVAGNFTFNIKKFTDVEVAFFNVIKGKNLLDIVPDSKIKEFMAERREKMLNMNPQSSTGPNP